MPRDTVDRALQWLAQMLRDPPIILFLEVTNSDDACTTANSEFVFRRAPAYARRRTVDTQENEGRLPFASLARLPYVSVSVLAACYNTAGAWCDIYAGYCLVMSAQLIL